MHSAFLAAEILLKGGLSAKGCTDAELKHLGHNLEKLIKKSCQMFKGMEEDTALSAVNYLPSSVNERYEDLGYSTRELGMALMAVQYLGGEIMRDLSDCNLRASLRLDGKRFATKRVFP